MMGRMTDDPLVPIAAEYVRAQQRHKSAVDAVKRAERKRAEAAAEVEKLRAPLQEEIIGAVRRGVRPKTITEWTGYGPERVRQILRAAGVDPLERKSAT